MALFKQRSENATDTKSEIIRNSLYNVTLKLIHFVLAFINVPILLGYLGDYKYGIWVLAFTVIAYAEFFNLSFFSGYIKYVSQYYYNKDYASVNRINTLGIAFGLLLSGFVYSLFIGLREPIFRFLTVEPQNTIVLTSLVLILLGVFSANQILSPVRIMYQATQKVRVITISSTISLTLRLAAIIVISRNDFGIVAIAFSYLAERFLFYILLYLFTFKYYPFLKLQSFLKDKSILRNVFGFSIKQQVTTIATVFNLNIDKILISKFLQVVLLTPYGIAIKLIVELRSVIEVLLQTLVPALSKESASENRDFEKVLLRKGEKIYYTIVFFFIGLVFVTAKDLLTFWLKDVSGMMITTMRVLIIGHLLNLLTGVKSQICIGRAKPEYYMITSLITLILNVVLSYLLILRFGYYGAVIGSAVSLSVSSIVFMIIFAFKIPEVTDGWKAEIMKLLIPLLSMCLGGGVTIAARMYLIDFSFSDSIRLNAFLNGFSHGLVFIVVFALLPFLTGYVKDFPVVKRLWS